MNNEQSDEQKKEIASINIDNGDSLYEVSAEATSAQSNMVERAACEFIPEPATIEQQRALAEEAKKERIQSAAYQTGRGIQRGFVFAALSILAIIEIIKKVWEGSWRNKDSVMGFLQQVVFAIAIYAMKENAGYWVGVCLLCMLLLYLLKVRFGEGPLITNLRAWLQGKKKVDIISAKKYIKANWMTQIFTPGDDGEEGEERNG